MSRPRVTIGWLVWRLALFMPGRYFGFGSLWTCYFTLPLLTGLTLNALFDELSGGPPVDTSRALGLCAALAAIETFRGGLLWLTVGSWVRWLQGIYALLQTNVLRSLVGSEGSGQGPSAGRLPSSPGEAVSRCRYDVDDLALVVDNWVDVAAGTLFASVAFAVMLGIDPLIALVLVVPLVVVLVGARLMGPMLERWHREARRHDARVAAFIGDVFANVLTMKSSGAGPAVSSQLRRINSERRDAAVRNRLGQALLDTFTGSTGQIGVGIVLLLAVPGLQRGDFTVGELALFTTYVSWLTMFPETVGRIFYRHRRGKVAAERLVRLLGEDEGARDLVRHRQIWASHPPRQKPTQDQPAGNHPDGRSFQHLAVTGLTAFHPGSEVGVEDVDLEVPRGTLTVLTGAIGSGKTTLLRAILGMIRADHGTIRWNGEMVDPPELFLVPPRVAYVSQVPRLFSDTLEENLRLGWMPRDGDLATAVHLSAFDRDVSEMPDGLATVVGSRGARLSGGQIQRATAARALVRMPELLLVDDLSSALDVETEDVLWRRLAAASADGRGPTSLLVVSHRKAALQQADQIVVLDRGRVVGTGSWDHLLSTSPEFRRLWSEELVVEAEERL